MQVRRKKNRVKFVQLILCFMFVSLPLFCSERRAIKKWSCCPTKKTTKVYPFQTVPKIQEPNSRKLAICFFGCLGKSHYCTPCFAGIFSVVCAVPGAFLGVFGADRLHKLINEKVENKMTVDLLEQLISKNGTAEAICKKII